jgi:hypothetical protein|nr:MAG TPA: hypothetical protein [Caudoviricetes sp.]
MAFIVDTNGNITLVQGDSGNLVITGLPIDKNYTVYFAIQDENRKPIGEELRLETQKQQSINFEILSALTDLLSVRVGEETATYYYGIKLCSKEDFLEDTLLIGNSKIGELNSITVYPKKVEGD